MTALPATMSAMAFRRFGPPEVLEQTEMPTPHPARGEVVVRVGAVSVGRLLDLSARAGTHPFASFQFPHVLGAEHAGTIAAVGPDVTRARPDERVAVLPTVTCGQCDACGDGHEEACAALELIGVHRPGAYAEYCVAPERNVYPIPDELGWVDASALVLSGPVAQSQLTEAGVGKGTWVLVQGGASALGSLTAALALHRGARVIATSRTQWKRERLLQLGVEAALDPYDDEFEARVRALTGGRGVDVAVDDIGEPNLWSRTMAALATRGILVSSGAFRGGQVALDLRRLYSASQRIIGIRTGNRPSAQAFWREVTEGFRPILDRTFPLEEAADAHRHLEEDKNFGRVALTVDTPPSSRTK